MRHKQVSVYVCFNLYRKAWSLVCPVIRLRSCPVISLDSHIGIGLWSRYVTSNRPRSPNTTTILMCVCNFWNLHDSVRLVSPVDVHMYSDLLGLADDWIWFLVSDWILVMEYFEALSQMPRWCLILLLALKNKVKHFLLTMQIVSGEGISFLKVFLRYKHYSLLNFMKKIQMYSHTSMCMCLRQMPQIWVVLN